MHILTKVKIVNTKSQAIPLGVPFKGKLLYLPALGESIMIQNDSGITRHTSMVTHIEENENLKCMVIETLYSVYTLEHIPD